MKLEKQTVTELNDILGRLNSVKKFIEKPEVHICKETSMTSNDLFVNKDGLKIHSMTKFIGSELNNINNVIDRLNNILQKAN